MHSAAPTVTASAVLVTATNSTSASVPAPASVPSIAKTSKHRRGRHSRVNPDVQVAALTDENARLKQQLAAQTVTAVAADAASDALQCLICHEVKQDIVLWGKCRHAYCKGCVFAYLKQSLVLPSAHRAQNLIFTPTAFAEQIAGSAFTFALRPLKCPQCRRVDGLTSIFNEHLEPPPFSMLRCLGLGESVGECSFCPHVSGLRSNLEHTLHCGRRRIECPFSSSCGAAIVLGESLMQLNENLLHHLLSACNTPAACARCPNSVMPISRVQHHMALHSVFDSERTYCLNALRYLSFDDFLARQAVQDAAALFRALEHR